MGLYERRPAGSSRRLLPVLKPGRRTVYREIIVRGLHGRHESIRRVD